MKIGFYSSMPLEDKRNWSGTMHKMYEQIVMLQHEVVWIPKFNLSKEEEKSYKKFEKLFQKIFRRGYNQHINYYKARIISKKIDKYLDNNKFDFIFAPTVINDFALSNTKTPIVYLNDANVGQLLNYYPYYSGFGWLSKKETVFLEKKLLQKTAINIFSSQWAADYAVNNYKIAPEKVIILKFGANLDVPENWTFNKDIKDEITFLFLAVDWVRKRGDLAYRALKILRKNSYKVRMQIIGCNPEIEEDWVNIIPFLNKNNPTELEEIQKHLQNSHFLFVPTHADCTPIAFCEATGYGLPVISTNTGGVSAHVENGKTGILLSEKATIKDYADAIKSLLENVSIIEKFSIASREKYEKELNWDVWRIEFDKLIKNFIYHKK
ncbi:glycosyltransferase family 4 protein [Chryseobacterium scophthalmum]|uniref:glycosyltransferase family 4 protein n=1 Tax=Chryseobacterium scophthalmum TaxID=59733 RepID=UPI003CFC7BC5